MTQTQLETLLIKQQVFDDSATIDGAENRHTDTMWRVLQMLSHLHCPMLTWVGGAVSGLPPVLF